MSSLITPKPVMEKHCKAMWYCKSTNFASQEQTSDCYIDVQGESQALSTNLPMLYRDIEFWKKDSLDTDESDCNYT